jgi:hypothetical protein
MCTAPAAATARCHDAKCEFDCVAGRQKCEGACIDPKSDPQNCGGCGKACPAVANATSSCSDGQCTFSCNAGLSQCGGVCVDTRSDVMNCGKCGKKCGGKQTCLLGLCLL